MYPHVTYRGSPCQNILYLYKTLHGRHSLVLLLSRMFVSDGHLVKCSLYTVCFNRVHVLVNFHSAVQVLTCLTLLQSLNN